VFWTAVKKFKLTRDRQAGLEMIRSSLEAVKLDPDVVLDAQVRKNFLDILVEFQENYGMTTLFITHDLSTVTYLGWPDDDDVPGIHRRAGAGSATVDQSVARLHQAAAGVGARSGRDQRWRDRVVITDGRPHVVAEADLLAVPAQYGPSGPQGGTSA